VSLDLPLIWAGVIATAVLLYVLLDGFDLGVGILFPFARSAAERDTMMAAIAPYWDGNETWLVLGGGGLLAAFPGAYAALLSALYVPIMLMLLALVLRGVAFEFRARGRRRGKAGWTFAFAFGSTAAAATQGLALGGFMQGLKMTNGAFSGGAFDWLSPYALVTAAGLVCGYALLGAGWLMIKTRDALHGDARRWAVIAAALVALLLAVVSVMTLFVHPQIAARWGWLGGHFDLARLAPLLPIPILGGVGLAIVAAGLARRSHIWPFLGAIVVFLSGYLGLAASFFPYVAPYGLTFREAANDPSALGLMFGGLVVVLPLILAYTAWVYWVFRGKVADDEAYH
jgi:cytochrome d ubiquinol oxidase subunit II